MGRSHRFVRAARSLRAAEPVARFDLFAQRAPPQVHMSNRKEPEAFAAAVPAGQTEHYVEPLRAKCPPGQGSQIPVSSGA